METARTIDIEASRVAIGLQILAGLATTMLFVAIALHAFPAMDDVRDLMIGGVGSAAGLIWTGLGLRRVWMRRGAIVTIAPDGIRDRRVGGDMVPWSVVARVTTREDYRNKIMVISIDPRSGSELPAPRAGRRARAAARRLGADGLCVTALGLRTSHETLVATTLAYLEAWRSRRG